MERHCQSPECNNIIRGRRADSKYCSETCKQVAKRHRKENGIVLPVTQGKIKISNTGDLITDISTSATAALFAPSADPVLAMGNNALKTCLPYALEKVAKRPIFSLLAAIGGSWVAGKYFTNCTTTKTTEEDGKTKTSVSCKNATGLQKSGSAAVAVLGGNYIWDVAVELFSPENRENRSIDTGLTRVKHVSTPPYTPNTVQFSAS